MRVNPDTTQRSIAMQTRRWVPGADRPKAAAKALASPTPQGMPLPTSNHHASPEKVAKASAVEAMMMRATRPLSAP